MILNNVHDLSFYFPLHRRESIGTLSFTWLYTFCFVFCVWSTQHDSNKHAIVYIQWIYISETNNRRSQCWNGMSSIHLFICSIHFWSQRNNFNERLFFFNCPLYNTAIHLLSTNYCWPIRIDIYWCNSQLTFLFLFISFSLYLYKWK